MIAPRLGPLPLAFVLCGVTLVAFVAVGSPIQTANVGVGLWFTEVFLFLGLPWVVVRLSGRAPAAYSGLDRYSTKAVTVGFVLGAVNFFALVAPLHFLAQQLAPPEVRELFDATRIFENQTPIERVLTITGVGLAAPVCEEFFFRGLVQRGLAARLSPFRAVLLCGAVFSAFHLEPIGALARLELGVLFGILYARTGSLWPAIGAHAANNLVSTALFLLTSDGAGDEADLRSVLAVAGAGLVTLVALVALLRRFPTLLPVRPPTGDLEALSDPPRPLQALWPWAMGALTCVVLLMALDARGVRLNYIDAAHRLPRARATDSEAERAERDALQDMRRRARAAEADIADYAERRAELARRLTAASSPSRGSDSGAR